MNRRQTRTSRPNRITRWLAMGLALMVLASGARAQLSTADIDTLRRQGAAQGWTFTVSENPATFYPIPMLCGLVPPDNWAAMAPSAPVAEPVALPSAFDWRTSYTLTPIRDQGGCGSCWAFATVGVLESNIAIKRGLDVDLSEQWLISCNTNGWNCEQGGWFAYDFFQSATDSCGDSGAVLEADFPYTATDGVCDCPYPHHYWIDSWGYVGGETGVPSPDTIKQAILQYGPVACAIYVNGAFTAYKGGVFNASDNGVVNHGVVLVGWDDDQGANGVWILRNSWGTAWGEEGYMRIEYGCSKAGYGANYAVYTGAHLMLSPAQGLHSAGHVAGPFYPPSHKIALTNRGANPLVWTAAHAGGWLALAPTSGTLAPGAKALVSVSITDAAKALAIGTYQDIIVCDDLTDAEETACTFTLQVKPPLQPAFRFFSLDTNPGWACAEKWQFGKPLGLGTHDHDPASGFTGQNVYGYNLTGDYDNNMAPQYLTTPAFNCSAFQDVKLTFWRWLAVESSDYDHATVQASNNGTTWTTVWANGGESISDSNWFECEYDISAVADGAATLYVRWVMGPTDSGLTFPGWNIDDVALRGDLAGPGAGARDHLLGRNLLTGPPLQAADQNGDGIIGISDIVWWIYENR